MKSLLLCQRGWHLKGQNYFGFYRTWYHTFEGKIRKRSLHCGDFFIREPPYELKNHPHWVCFHSKGNGWYEIHFDKAPKSLEEGIRCIEVVLIEAYRITHRR
ncbi:MAG: hypothetical protein R3F48_13600 [Candidatus Zixiibacteriota bacterium]